MTEITTRGSQYDSSCFRELFYSEKVDENLKKFNIRCANLPVGFWKYDKELQILPRENIKKRRITKVRKSNARN